MLISPRARVQLLMCVRVQCVVWSLLGGLTVLPGAAAAVRRPAVRRQRRRARLLRQRGAALHGSAGRRRRHRPRPAAAGLGAPRTASQTLLATTSNAFITLVT